MKIDAHQHFWDLSNTQFDYSWTDNETNRAIHQTYLPETLKPQLDACGVAKSVFVQTQHSQEENRWILKLAEKHEWIAGIVGWVDLASDECEAQLSEFIEHPKFVGVRHITHDEPDDNFIVGEAVMRGLKVLQKHAVPFDLLFFVKHLRHVQTLGNALPELPMVIDHLAKPHIKSGKIDNWKNDFIGASKFPNVYCKLSGMITEANWENWRPEDLKPYVDLALEHFGPERCMYGSDWPVCELAGSYVRVHDALADLIGELTESEQAAIWSQNAVEFYGLTD